MYGSAVTRKPYKYTWDCAYANGLPDWAEGVDVVVLMTCARNFNVSILGGEGLFWLHGRLGIEPRVAQTLTKNKVCYQQRDRPENNGCLLWDAGGRREHSVWINCRVRSHKPCTGTTWTADMCHCWENTKNVSLHENMPSATNLMSYHTLPLPRGPVRTSSRPALLLYGKLKISVLLRMQLSC
jgi:hypothetical protein